VTRREEKKLHLLIAIYTHVEAHSHFFTLHVGKK
jgi:hypothetical protein